MSDLAGWELYLRHSGRDGSLKNGYIAPITAAYTNSLDRDEALSFTLHVDTYTELESITEFDLVEVMIRNRFLGVQSASGGFVRDFVGIVRGSEPDRFTDERGQTYLTWICPEQKHLFGWRRVAWPAGTINRATFDSVPAETAVKTLIDYNCTTLATVVNGRWRDGDLAAGMLIELDMEADAARGNNISLSFAGGVLLDVLSRACELGGDYYALDWQGGAAGGAHQFGLTWGRGSDKSAGSNRVLFSLENNTLLDPRRRYEYAAGTTAIAAGQGEGSNRQISLVDGADYAADNDIELFVDARNSTTAVGREGQAAEKLQRVAEVSEFTFEVLQTGDVFYSPVAVTGRKTYHVGDRVLVSYGSEEVRRIREARVDWNLRAGSDSFRVGIETELWA